MVKLFEVKKTPKNPSKKGEIDGEEELIEMRERDMRERVDSEADLLGASGPGLVIPERTTSHPVAGASSSTSASSGGVGGSALSNWNLGEKARQELEAKARGESIGDKDMIDDIPDDDEPLDMGEVDQQLAGVAGKERVSGWPVQRA